MSRIQKQAAFSSFHHSEDLDGDRIWPLGEAFEIVGVLVATFLLLHHDQDNL